MTVLDQPFLIKLLLSFLVGSIWITSITVIAERFGSKIGGFVGGLPSTVVVALLFIGLSQSPQDASRAAGMIPLVMGLNGLFVVVYLALVHRGPVKALVTALSLWSVIIALVILLQVESLLVSFLVWSLSFGLALYITENVMSIAPAKGIRVPYTPNQILVRGLVSGFIISMAVLISRLAGPAVGGIFSNFPVIFTSTLFITYRSGGLEFSKAVAKTLMLSGMINVGVFSFSTHYTYQYYGLATGTVISILITALAASGTYRLLKRIAS